MVATDNRSNHIIETARRFFGLGADSVDTPESSELDLLDNFFDRPKCRTLYATSTLVDSSPRNWKIRLSDRLPNGRNTLVFFKISETVVTEDNFRDVVQITSISGNGRQAALAESIRQVWCPALEDVGYDSLSLKKLANELRHGGSTRAEAGGSILVEERAVQENLKNSTSSEEMKLLEHALLCLKSIRRELESATTSREGLVMVEETFDSISGHLDDLWKLKGPIYSEQRMRSLLEIIGSEVARVVKTLICKVRTDARAKDEAISRGAQTCEKWIAMSSRLTGLFWPYNSSHAWKGKPYKPEKCGDFEAKLKEIADIRAQNRQLTRLLNSNERHSLGTDAQFSKFDNIEELLAEEDSLEWDRVRNEVYSSLAPVEERVAAKLKSLLVEARTPLALETEFRRYGDLMKRDTIKQLLRSERQQLLATYSDLIDACLGGPDTNELLDSPEILRSVQTARVSELRLESLQKLGKQLLADLPGYDEVAQKLATAFKEVEKQRQELTESWINEMRDSILNNEITLGKETSVVELTRSNLMRVNYNPRLTGLIREARGLAGQGVELPRELKELVARATALTGRARALQQIANFYNTIGDRQTPSQRPLMQASAQELAAAVRDQVGVAWSDPRAVDRFTERLRDLVKKFALQNAELASRHAALRNSVCNLLKGDAINLVANQNTWKETLRHMREIVGSVESRYGNTAAWKLHWDRQLLKALAIAYRAALPTLLKKLPELRLDLTYRDESLQWRPHLEDVRMKLYTGVRRFLVIPANFRGLGDQADAQFPRLVPRSAHLFGAVYREAEILLDALEIFRLKWLPLVAPAKIDIGHTLKGKQAQDWEKAFKEAKQWAQEVGKLRANEVKLSCIVVDTATIRNDLELLSRRYWEQLSLDLRAEASSRLISIVDFLSTSSKKLQQRSRTIEEIGEAFDAYTQIQSQTDEIIRELEDVTGLSRVLAAWTKEKLDGLNNAHIAWESLKERLDTYQNVMVRQLEEAKVNLNHQVLAVRDEQERWVSKWLERPEAITPDWLENMREKWTNIQEQRNNLINDCKKLNVSIEDVFASDEKIIDQMEEELTSEEINCKLQSDFMDELRKQEEEEWSIVKKRIPKLYDWLDSWRNQVKSNEKQQLQSSQSEKGTKQFHSFIEKKIESLSEDIDLIQVLRSDELAEEHWTELKEILRLDVGRTNEITLGHLLSNVHAIRDNYDRIKEVTKRAGAESGIRQALSELEAWESYTILPLQPTKDSKNNSIHLVGDYSTLLTRAGELRLIMEGARGAAGYERFASRAARCETALTELEDRLKILSVVQRKWVYLEPVLSSGAAPNDAGRWSRVDKEFRYFMSEIFKDPRIPSLKKLPFHALTSLKDLMDRCQRSLDDFLEEKRSAYPRLYFLSDEDLLELISGKGKGFDAHLSKLFQSLGSVKIESNKISSIVSPEGEELKLTERVDCSISFPLWLISLEKGMRNALRQSLNTCLLEQQPDIGLYPTQILLLCERIRFTERCEAALDDDKGSDLRNLLKLLENLRSRYRSLESSEDPIGSLKAKNLLLETVHHLSIVRSLLRVAGDREKLVWTWQRQLRTYKSGGDALIRCSKAEFAYRFEYQGAAVGLVRTPLTEKCYLALTQAMRLGLGGSPTGPAGTGKTESVKALGSILGRRVLVFNCDEGMDAGSMRRILSGLAQAGAWGCFDEFNRLEEGTMSAVAMLIRPLQEAIRDGEKRANLGGLEIGVDPHCCLFVTMNPAGDDYGGRRKLPDSLARLFRPIGMAHPNKEYIVRSLLECYGFENVASLSNKLIETFDAAEKLLSQQPHYDWGLRALRSVLNAVQFSIGQNDDDDDGLDESSRLLQGIKISVMPKLVEKDSSKFLTLLADIFLVENSILESAIRSNKELQSVLTELCDAKGYSKTIVNRCIQLNDQLQSRSGVAVVGPPGSGKTLIIDTLAQALTKIGSHVKKFVIYPGAIPKTRLLGSVDTQTREYREGILSYVISNFGDQPLWLVLDGDVEPDWAESLNSALDDNRILTLPNGVGIKLGNETRFVFETHKLSGASPATVSRLGIVHLAALTAKSLIQQLPTASRDLPSSACQALQNYFSPLAERVWKATAGQKSAAGLLSAALPHFERANTQAKCTYAYVGSVCGQIEDQQARDELIRYVYQQTDVWCPDSHNPYDALYNEKKDTLDPFAFNVKTQPTDDGPVYLSGPMQRGVSASFPWLKDGQAVVLRGETGCGKSALVSTLLTLIREESGQVVALVKGSSLYGPKDLLSRLKRACVKLDSATGRTYKPKNGASLVLVVEDLHLATKDFQELVRQLIQEKGFYEDDLEFAKVSLSLLCTSDNGAKFHPRLDSLLATHYLPKVQPKDLKVIVELNLSEHLKANEKQFKSWISKVSTAVVQAYFEMSSDNKSSSSNQNNNNKWTTRDVIAWIGSLKYYPPADREGDLTGYLIDASRRIFRPKLIAKEQKRLETIVSAQAGDAASVHRRTTTTTTTTTSNSSNEATSSLYVWKSNHAGLAGLSESEWKSETDNAVMRCIREGDSISPTVTSYLLEIAADISWNWGCERRGILLSGRPGAGRKWAVKVVSVISNVKLISSGPGRAKIAIKNAVQSAGIDGERTILLIEENHLREEGIAVLIGAIVSQGELPGLYSTEELDGLMVPLADLAAREEFSKNLEQFLYHRLRKFLRVAVIVDTNDLHGDLVERSNLLRCCSESTGQSLGRDWWLTESYLRELVELYKKPSGKITTTSQDEADDIDAAEKDEGLSGARELIECQVSASARQQAPARFCALLRKWRELREDWSRRTTAKLRHLRAGIDRLKEAGERVAKLEEDASKHRHELELERGRANAALEQITATMRGATGQRGEMASLKAETERESVELARRKADIELELGKVKPLVDQASQAVAGISSDALSEVRSLRAPPAAVRDVLEGVLRLMGIKDTSWNSMKTFLAKRGVKEEIRGWDARRSTAQGLDAVEKLVRERPDSFDEKTARRASVAAAPLAAWVLANLQYGKIVLQVAPLEREQRVLADRLNAAEAEIGKLQSGLDSVESKVAQLQEELAAHSRGAAELELRSQATESSLATARALLAKLDAEHADWQSQLGQLADRRQRVGLEAARAAALLVYEQSSSSQKQQQDEERLGGRAIELLISERDKLQWRAQGLPADTESFVGACRSLRGVLTPLFLDPAGVAVAWLRANQGSSLETTRPGDPRFLTSVELAVRFGKPLLVEEMNERLPDVLLPLLRGGPLKIADKLLPVQEGFRLFLATRKENLGDELPSEADALLMKVALGAGSRSLVERLVDKAILQETPEIEQRRREALQREEKLSGEIEAARQDLLLQLGQARGQDLLQESQGPNGQQQGLLSTLELTQSKAREIARALEQSRRDLDDMAKRSREHERLAKYGAVLHKFVRSFSALSSLYVFTAEQLAEMFLEAERGRAALKSLAKDEREKSLEKTMITLVLHHCSNAVYRKHRLSLALHLAVSLSSVPDEQRALLLNGKTGAAPANGVNLPNFILPEQKTAVEALIRALPEMANKLKPSWTNNIVSIYADDDLTQFEKLLIVQALHPEHLHTALSKWAAQQLGVKSLTPPAWTLKKIADENTQSRPVLLLLSPGADPEPELRALVTNQAVTCGGFTEVSLSQGQVGQAEAALESACKNGSWILLSNLQLAKSWLPRLEALLRSAACSRDKHPQAKIWLTTEECGGGGGGGFYPGLAGLCLKLAYEPPEGVKRNVRRSLQQLQQRQPALRDPCKSLLVAWLHAVLQERRKFVPQGWIKSYAWSEADLEAACELVVRPRPKDSLRGSADADYTDWESDRGLLDVAVYGGQLQDRHDMRMLRALLRSLWCRDTYSGRRKLGSVIGVPRALQENPILIADRLDDADSIQAYFGLPANAHRAWEKSAAEISLAYLKDIMKQNTKTRRSNRGESSSGSLAKTTKDLVAAIDQLRVDVHSSRDKRGGGGGGGGSAANDPLSSFFGDEIDAARRLLHTVRADLDTLRAARDDLTTTPKRWTAAWPSGPKDTVAFVNQLISRYRSLVSLGGNRLPDRVELAWFARPDAFLSVLKQFTARELAVAPESLRLGARWTEAGSEENAWKRAVQLDGLMLTGARIEAGVLEEVTASASSSLLVQNCSIAFVADDKDRDDDHDPWSDDDLELGQELNALQVPVYTDAFKSRLVASLPVPYIKDQKDIWHQRGVNFHLRSN